MAGYSKRSLVEKLGIKPGFRVLFVNKPDGYSSLLGKLPKDLEEATHQLDFIQFFTKERKESENNFPKLKDSMKKDGMLWISWPKSFRRKDGGSERSRTTKLSTDLNENIIRAIGLKNGMVDVKVIAVDETWSGLKFVIRLKDR